MVYLKQMFIDYIIIVYKVSDLVLKIYENNNIDLVRGEKSNIWYEKNTNKEVLCINDNEKGLDRKSINIKGYPGRLRYHEWKIKYSIEDILKEFS